MTLYLILLFPFLNSGIVPKYEDLNHVPSYSGELLHKGKCLHSNDTALILRDYTKTGVERGNSLSRITCRKPSNLECVDGVCECMAFGNNETGVWHQFHLMCYAKLGSSCQTRAILFPGK